MTAALLSEYMNCNTSHFIQKKYPLAVHVLAFTYYKDGVFVSNLTSSYFVVIRPISTTCVNFKTVFDLGFSIYSFEHRKRIIKNNIYIVHLDLFGIPFHETQLYPLNLYSLKFILVSFWLNKIEKLSVLNSMKTLFLILLVKLLPFFSFKRMTYIV